jgi:spore coat protein H
MKFLAPTYAAVPCLVAWLGLSACLSRADSSDGTGSKSGDPDDSSERADAGASGGSSGPTEPRRVDAGAADGGGVQSGDGGVAPAGDAAGEPSGSPGADAGSEPDGSSASGAVEPAGCQPSAGGPYTVVETEELTFEVACQKDFAADATFKIEPLPRGAKYDDTTATLKWTPGLDQAGTYELTVRAEPPGASGSVRIAVLDRFDAPDNVPISDPLSYAEEYGLPVIHLILNGAINDDAYTPATVIYRGHNYTGAEARFRGMTSASYPKRSFTLKFAKEDKFGDPGAAGGFLAKRKIVLTTSFDDNSYLRQRLNFELWNRLDPDAIQVQTYSVVLFLNGQYHGLYTLGDHIDGYLMEDHGLFQDGNLYKARADTANFRELNPDGSAKATPHDGLTKEEGMPLAEEPGAYDDLDEFISWVIRSTPESFGPEVDQRMRRADYENWWILATFTMADDSVNKNAYHYHDPTTPGSLWRCVPWDFNHSFGQTWKTERSGVESAPEDYYVKANAVFERILGDPKYGPALRERYGRILRSSFTVEAVRELVDRMASEITPSAHRDETKWRAAYRDYDAWRDRTDFTTFDEEVQYLRRWVGERHAYLAERY